MRLREITGTMLPILLDQDLQVARSYDFLPKAGQPMGGMGGVAQMGFVVVDPEGTIRIQRADLLFGEHAGQIVEILEIIKREQASGTARYPG